MFGLATRAVQVEEPVFLLDLNAFEALHAEKFPILVDSEGVH